jgi:hypothetical protein
MGFPQHIAKVCLTYAKCFLIKRSRSHITNVGRYTDKPWTDKPWTDKPWTDKPWTRQTLDTTNPGQYRIGGTLGNVH